MNELLGVSDGFALFGNDAGLTVVVNLSNLDVFDPIPKVSVDFSRWGDADPSQVPTEAFELADSTLSAAAPVDGTDVIIAGGAADKRSFAIPKAAQAEAQKALKWHAEHHRGGTDVGMNTARTLAKGGSVGIAKVRHIARALSRMMQTWNELTALDAVNPSRTMSPTVVPAEMLALMLTHDARYAALQTSEKDAGGHQRGSATTASAHGAQQRDDSGAQTTQTANSQRTSAQDFEPPKSATRTLNTENALSVTTGSDASTGSQPTPTTAWKQRSVGAAGSANARATSGADSQLTTTRTREKFADFYARRATSLSDNFSTTEQFWSELSSTSPLLTERLAELRIAWALWGGDSAWKWASAIVKRDKELAALAAIEAQMQEPEPEEDADLSPDAEFEDTYEPGEPHEYIPDFRHDYLCEVCGQDEISMQHVPVEDEALTAAGESKIVNAEKFFAVEVDLDDDEPDFYAALEYRADDTPSMVTALYAVKTNDTWVVWSPGSHNWSDAPEQTDVVPMDPDSAYEVAVLFDQNGGQPVPAPEINRQEWDLVDGARSSLEGLEQTALEELEFCVVMGEEKHGGSSSLVISEIFLSDPDGACWRWNPALVDWEKTSQCPDDCMPVDYETARAAAQRLTRLTQHIPESNGGRFHQRTPANSKLGPGLKPPGGKTVGRPGTRTPNGMFEFDGSFARAAWISGTRGVAAEYGGPGNTATSFSIMELDSTPGIYTPEERSKNAGTQPRDANGRFVKQGGSVHVKGNRRTAKIIGVNREKGTVTIQYPDGTTQERPASEVTNISSDKPDTGADERTTKINPDDYGAEARATKITPKAWLDKLLPVLDRAEINKMLDDFQKYIEELRKRGGKTTFAALTPDTSDAKPLYLAQVDELDKQAVVELIALVPKTKTTSEVLAYVRAEGGWQRDDAMLRRIKSVTPPPLVVLDEATYEQVLTQVDSYFTDKGKDESEESDESIVAALLARTTMKLWDDTGALIPAFEAAALTAAGVPGVADTPGDAAAARRLRNYWLRGRGAAKIRWNTPGDWTRCVRHLSKYMGVRARGYCFSGDTEFTTRDGVMTFEEAVGTTQFVLTTQVEMGSRVIDGPKTDGYWVEARIEPFGEQQLLEITLQRGGVTKVIRATPEHRWFASPNGRNIRRQDLYELTTAELKPGMVLAALFAAQSNDLFLSPDGIRAGLVFGDGSKHSKNRAIIDLWGDNQDLLVHFEGYAKGTQKELPSGVLGTRVLGLPVQYKDAPSFDADKDYLYGWLAGYFAADGSVSNGAPTLWSASREALEHAKHVATILGISTGSIGSRMRSGFGRPETELFHMAFARWSLRPDFFLKSAHRAKFGDGTEKSSGRWAVVSVEDHGDVEPVFCAVVPETHKFVLTEGILTSNCQNLHKDATGLYTGDTAHRAMYGKKLLSAPTVVLTSADDISPETQFLALLEVSTPTVQDLADLSTREPGHHLRIGERFLANGGDGLYALSVLEPTSTIGWEGTPAVLVGGEQYATLLQEA